MTSLKAIPANDDRAATGRHANQLLAAMPGAVYERISASLEPVSLERGQVLHKAGAEILHLYFPIDALISVTITMRDGRTAETGIVGRREVVGINAFMGGTETTQTEYEVQVPGDALRIGADVLREEFDTDKGMRDVLLKYTQAMLAQLSQNAACSRLHQIEQRYARWLLESRDRIASEDLELTQEFISDMLGVRRAGISEASDRLRKAGIVQTTRGRTRILDSEGLEAASCECYEVLVEEYDRLLGTEGFVTFGG
ncbi:MAG: cyclic nucleotide-binding protein [Gemmatimonadetes bacterium]|nr:cyclic nucleotide-binding protein [Gemmatimonadota bacterium]